MCRQNAYMRDEIAMIRGQIARRRGQMVMGAWADRPHASPNGFNARADRPNASPEHFLARPNGCVACFDGYIGVVSSLGREDRWLHASVEWRQRAVR